MEFGQHKPKSITGTYLIDEIFGLVALLQYCLFCSKKSRDYTAPVSFISGGLKEGSDKKRQYDTDEEENMDNYEEEMAELHQDKPMLVFI